MNMDLLCCNAQIVNKKNRYADKNGMNVLLLSRELTTVPLVVRLGVLGKNANHYVMAVQN